MVQDGQNLTNRRVTHSQVQRLALTRHIRERVLPNKRVILVIDLDKMNVNGFHKNAIGGRKIATVNVAHAFQECVRVLAAHLIVPQARKMLAQPRFLNVVAAV